MSAKMTTPTEPLRIDGGPGWGFALTAVGTSASMDAGAWISLIATGIVLLVGAGLICYEHWGSGANRSRKHDLGPDHTSDGGGGG